MGTPTATIAVTRQRPQFGAAPAGPWLVFIDGVWVGSCPKGETVRFEVPAGPHRVKIWRRGGGGCSPDLEVDLAPGSVRALVCHVNRERWASLYSGGVRVRNRAQIDFLRKTINDGWIARDAIALHEGA